MAPKKYSSVVFAAYVVPTIPNLSGAVGDPDGAGFVSGTYVGLPDPREDVQQRVKLISNAAAQAYDSCPPETRDDPSVLHIFVVPEFYFRGLNGAYEVGADRGLLKYLVDQLRSVADGPKYKHWMFVCGTVLESDEGGSDSDPQKKLRAAVRSDLAAALAKAYDVAPDDETKDFVFDMVQKCTSFAQAHPLYLVRNRCYAYKQGWEEWPQGVAVDKCFVSHEDFVMSTSLSPSAYAEGSIAYPYIDESSGELKAEAFDAKCIFTVDGITFALEICLDHRRARLRTVREKNESSRIPVDVHLVVSCGMQIQSPAVVAKTGGLVFNCDGQYANIDKGATPDEEHSIFTGSADGKGHTQLCVVVEETEAKRDAVVGRPAVVEVTTAPLRSQGDVNVDALEAYGAGEVHVYSKCPLPL